MSIEGLRPGTVVTVEHRSEHVRTELTGAVASWTVDWHVGKDDAVRLILTDEGLLDGPRPWVRRFARWLDVSPFVAVPLVATGLLCAGVVLGLAVGALLWA